MSILGHGESATSIYKNTAARKMRHPPPPFLIVLDLTGSRIDSALCIILNYVILSTSKVQNLGYIFCFTLH